MEPMTRGMSYYFNLIGWRYWVCGDKFTVVIAGEEYVIQRLGLRRWECKKDSSLRVFKSQHEVIAWLDSRW